MFTKNEIKKTYFAGFCEYLKNIGVDPDMFPNDLWLSKIWDMYYAGYADEIKLKNNKLKIISSMPIEDLKAEIERREKFEKQSIEVH